MSILAYSVTIFIAYTMLGLFSYYFSMFFYFIGAGFGLIKYIFDWLSFYFVPVQGYVYLVYSVIPFFLIFMIIKSLIIRSQK